MRAVAALAACLPLHLVACHDGEPRGVHDGDPIVGSWSVLNRPSSASVTFEASGAYAERGTSLFSGVAYAWQRESPDHISVLSHFGPATHVQAVLTGDLQGLSLVWDANSVTLARLATTDGGGALLRTGTGGAPGRDGSPP